LEDIDRVLTHIPADVDETFQKGLQGVRKRFHDALAELGV
jgi:molecular chaperone GrpE (heat shock protein)